jgi:hypothetical protein
MSRQHLISISLAALLGGTSLVTIAPVYAGDAGAFIGGAIAGQVIGQTRRNRKAIEAQQRSQAAQPVQQAAPAPATQSTQQKLEELDKLAAGGYITPEEYKAKRKTILDSM